MRKHPPGTRQLTLLQPEDALSDAGRHAREQARRIAAAAAAKATAARRRQLSVQASRLSPDEMARAVASLPPS